MAEIVNEHYQEFFEKSRGLSPEALKELFCKYYGKDRFVDRRNGNVYEQGFFYKRDPGNARFYNVHVLAPVIFTLEELENLKPIK